MNCLTICLTVINTIAIIVIPLVAVELGQYLQNQAKIRDDQMWVFKTLMTYRALGWANESIYALNIIEIVFAKDKEVLEQWRICKDRLFIENPSPTDFEKIRIEKYQLLEKMAKALKYNISWEIIQNPYLPQGVIDDLTKKRDFQNSQIEILKIMGEKMNPNNPNLQNEPQEKKK